MPTTTALLAGRYRLDVERGGCDDGAVWAAYDLLLHRDVAIKEIRFPEDMPADERSRRTESALREARAAALVDTTAAVRVFDVVEEDDRPWIVMEVVRGETLADVLAARRSLPVPDVARIGLAVLEALEVAYRCGVAHCTVSADNIILGADRRVALSDFCSDLVADGAAATVAADLRALGATLQSALGRRADADAKRLLQQLATDPPPVSETRRMLQQLARRSGFRPPAGHRDGPDRAREESPTWPLLVAVLVVLVASAIVLSAVLQRGA